MAALPVRRFVGSTLKLAARVELCGLVGVVNAQLLGQSARKRKSSITFGGLLTTLKLARKLNDSFIKLASSTRLDSLGSVQSNLTSADTSTQIHVTCMHHLEASQSELRHFKAFIGSVSLGDTLNDNPSAREIELYSIR